MTIRRFAVTLALALVPAAAVAQQPQQHKHPAAAAAAKPADHAAMAKLHEDFVQSLIAKRAELKLTDEQVKKLKDTHEDMLEHHEKMLKAEAKAEKHEMEGDAMHEQLMAIFTPAQRQQVEAMMKQHMKDCTKDADGKMQCKMDMGHMKH